MNGDFHLNAEDLQNKRSEPIYIDEVEKNECDDLNKKRK